MATSLGDFGTVREAAPAEVFTFGYFGVTYRTHPEMSDDYAMADLSELIVSIDTLTGLQQMASVKRLLTMLIHPEDFLLVWEAGRANRQTFEDLAQLAEALISAATERPTERPAGSSAGPPATTTKSEDDSSLQVQHDFAVAGRTDLALLVRDVRESRSA